MEPLRAMAGGADEQPNLFLLRNWTPDKKEEEIVEEYETRERGIYTGLLL